MLEICSAAVRRQSVYIGLRQKYETRVTSVALRKPIITPRFELAAQGAWSIHGETTHSMLVRMGTVGRYARIVKA